jgi:hypothetical protein
MAPGDRSRAQRALERAKEVVLYPLVTGLMLGLGTVLGRRLGEWYLEQRKRPLKASVPVRADGWR